MKWVKKSLEQIQKDVEDLKRFKWKFYGAVIVISGLVSLGVSVLFVILT